MNIINLKDEPYHIQQLAEWHHEEWSYLSLDGRLEVRVEKMKRYLGNEFVPSTIIGKIENELVGSAAILKHDMDTHYELSPWLASVYIRTDMRGKGVGAGLVKHVMKMAKEAGLVNMYLFTPSAQKFYESLGWSRKYVENYKGEEAIIMEVTL
jgi:N-acetylglutamate synthase-like GNAT family acetyltransferase